MRDFPGPVYVIVACEILWFGLVRDLFEVEIWQGIGLEFKSAAIV